MVDITLDGRDEAVLDRLREANGDVESLAESVGCDPESIGERLPELADNGLVRRVDGGSGPGRSESSDDHGDAVYAITANGLRVLASSPAGTDDDRIDTPRAVQEAIGAFDLGPGMEEAILNAHAFLHYWGEAFPSEIVDAVYSEDPAGYESGMEWWTEGVRDRLAALPRVDPPATAEQPWRYTGTATVDEATEDGRDVSAGGEGPLPSVKYALERSRLSEPERSAVRAAFAFLLREGVADGATIAEEVYPEHPAGYDSPEKWWADCVRRVFERLPGVERSDDPGDRWVYTQWKEGTTER